MATVPGVRQLLPLSADIDPAHAHAAAARSRADERPWVIANMVASADGATTVTGLSAGLSSPADKAVFSALRAVADVIVVGAATVRSEGYGPPRTPTDRQAERLERGQRRYPRLAVVSRSLDLDPDSPMFVAADEPPLVLTVSDAPPEKRAALADRAEVVELGLGSVEPGPILDALAERGARVVLTEGGPNLLGQFIAADLLDELNLTISPLLAGGTSSRVASAPQSVNQPMNLAHLWEAEGVLLARYVRA
ncbi:MAG: pyrimidine reductase family protein [Aquihabitans sp.]